MAPEPDEPSPGSVNILNILNTQLVPCRPEAWRKEKKMDTHHERNNRKLGGRIVDNFR
jgi:hypothetical protein